MTRLILKIDQTHVVGFLMLCLEYDKSWATPTKNDTCKFFRLLLNIFSSLLLLSLLLALASKLLINKLF